MTFIQNNNGVKDAFPNFIPQRYPSRTTVQASTVLETKKEKIRKSGSVGTIVNVILDESSSMMPATDSTIDAFNNWLNEQRLAGDDCMITLSKFNGYNVNYVYENKNITEVEPINRDLYRPHGSTNLLDAIGDSVNKTNKFLAGMKKKERPGVITIVITDGEENTSKSFSKSDIKELVSTAESKNWTFIFMGANIDAFSESNSLGFSAGSTVQYNTTNMTGSMEALSSITTRTRTAYANGLVGAELKSAATYTQVERDKSL